MRFVLNELHADDGFGIFPRCRSSHRISPMRSRGGGALRRDVLLPINRSGDGEGVIWKTACADAGGDPAYKQFAEGGWTALASDPEWGGQGLPEAVNKLVEEMICSSNLSASTRASPMVPPLRSRAMAVTRSSRPTCPRW
jgi:hypothetical protein